MVGVVPGKVPANVTVAELAECACPGQDCASQHTRAIVERVTRRKVVHPDAPSVAATSSNRRSAVRNRPSTATTRNGIATNDCAITTAAVVNGSEMPNVS